EEFADRIEVAQLVGQDADRLRTLAHFEGNDVLEDIGGEYDIQFLSGHVDDPAADRAQHEIEDDRNHKADRQGDERGRRAVGNDAIVNVHDEQGRGERQDVHEKSRQCNVRVVRPEAAD